MSEFHVEVGAYALDALDESERPAFEEHLAGCASCQRELAEFIETTTRLGALGDVPPPPALRASLLDTIRQVRPLPPGEAPPLPPGEAPPLPAVGADPTVVVSRRPTEAVRGQTAVTGQTETVTGPTETVTGPTETVPTQTVPTQPGTTPHRPGGAPRRRGAGPRRALEASWDDAPEVPGPRAGQTVPTTSPKEPADQLAQRRQRRRARLLTLAVAAVTVVALALGGWTYVLQREQQVAAAQSAATNRLLSAPDVRTYPVTVDGTPATFVVSKSLDEAMFVGANLPKAATGRTYQLWTVGSDANAQPDITFPGGPNTKVFIKRDIADAIAVAVSSEPAGGSTVPTTVPVVAEL